MADDETLLLAWRDGDRAAGSRLLERYFEPLFRFFRNKLDAGVDDLIQQTMIACLEARDRVRDAPNFRAFVFGVARNVLLVHFRRRKRFDRELDAGADSVADLGSSPSAIAHRRAEHRLLARALRSIPLDHQIALELFYWEGLSGAELAAALGIPEGTVRTRLRRARTLLVARMEQLAESPAIADTTRADLDRWARSLRDRLREGGQ